MNVTNELVSQVARNYGIEALPCDGEAAFEYFKGIYPGIIYNSETDSFTYRGIDLDYFKAGLFLEANKPNKFAYLLVSKNNRQNWLLTYGIAEERWKDFLERKRLRI